MSANDPKRTFNGLFCLAGVDRKPGVVVPLDHPPLPTTIWAVWSRRTRFSIWLARCSQGDSGAEDACHWLFGFHSRASFWASDIWAGVILLAMLSRFLTAMSRTSPGGNLETARLYHIWASA